MRLYLLLLLFAVVFAAAHLMAQQMIKDLPADHSVVIYHLVFLSLNAGALWGYLYVKKSDPNKTGMAFLVASTFKMLLALFYLVALKFSDEQLNIADISHFLIVFAGYFVADVIMILLILRSNSK